MITRIIISMLLLCLANSVVGEESSDCQKLEHQYNLNECRRFAKQPELALQFDEALLKFKVEQMEYNVTALKWQHYSTIIIFLVVMLLVLTGLYLSYLQFRTTQTAKRGSNPDDPESMDDCSNASIKITLQGISINSPVIGLLILFMSFAFFYLYITEVYELKPINLEQSINLERTSVADNPTQQPTPPSTPVTN